MTATEAQRFSEFFSNREGWFCRQNVGNYPEGSEVRRVVAETPQEAA